MFRRRRAAPEPSPAVAPPRAPWWARVERARELVRSVPSAGSLGPRWSAAEDALRAAEADLGELSAAITGLDHDRTLSDLKAAMRADPDDPSIPALQRRHLIVNELIDRREQLDGHIMKAVADLELAAAEAVRIGVTGRAADLDEHLAQLDVDVAALRAAHTEIADL